MTSQGGLQSRKQVQALLAQARQIAPDAAKGSRARGGAKAARDLLLHLDHPKVTLGLIVIKRHPKVLQESQHCLLMLAQSIEQVACSALFRTAPVTRLGLGHRMGSLTFAEPTGCATS